MTSVETKDLTFKTTTLLPSEPSTGYQDNDEFLLTVAQRLQSNIEQSIQYTAGSSLCINDSNVSSNNFDLMSNQSIDDIQKSNFTTVDQVLSSSRMPSVFFKELKREQRRNSRKLIKDWLNTRKN